MLPQAEAKCSEHIRVFSLASASLWSDEVPKKLPNIRRYCCNFRRFRKIAKWNCYLRYVRLSVRPSAWNNSASTRGIFMKFYSGLFLDNCEKMHVPLKFGKNNVNFQWRTVYIFYHILPSSLKKRNISDKSGEKIKTYIVCSITFFFPESLAVYEIILSNIAEPDKPQMKLWRMRISCWVTNCKHSHNT